MPTAHDSTLLTAIRSLERGLHPATTEAEILASVNAWRKKTKGSLLENVCHQLWDKRTSEGMTVIEFRKDWEDRFAEQEKRTADIIGENVILQSMLTKANANLKASQVEVAKLKKQEIKGGLPAIIDPNAPIPTIEQPQPAARKSTKAGYASPPFPLGHTVPIRVTFGDTFWDDVGWNPVRQKIVLKLLGEGIEFDTLATYFKGVERGKKDSWAYFADVDVSIKTRNAGEIYRELERAARALGCGLQVKARCADKKGRQSGKASGQYASDAAFPGQIITLEPDIASISVAAPEAEPETVVSEAEPEAAAGEAVAA